MTTTVQITDISAILDLTAVYGGYAADYDTDAVLDAYVSALQIEAQSASGTDSLVIARNGQVFADVAEAGEARDLDWKDIADQIDLHAILEANGRTA